MKRSISAILVLFLGVTAGFAQAPASAPAAQLRDAKAPAAAVKPPAGTNAPAATGLKDYSQGFAQFYKLGLPDVSKAEYVKVDVYSHDDSRMYGGMGSLYELKLAGNGWMLEETPKVKGRFVVDNFSVVEAWDNETLSKEREKKITEAMKTNKNARTDMAMAWEEEAKTTARWKKVDLKKDVDKVAAFLKKDDKSESGGRRRSYDRLAYGNTYGTLFLTAVHFHKKGYTNEANLIVAKLFERSGDARKVVGQAMSLIADVKYGEAYKKFMKDGTWEGFGKDIEELITKFAATWEKTPAAKKLLENVKQRAAQTQVPDLAGEGLTDADKALAAEVAAMMPDKKRTRDRYYGGGYYGELWVLPWPKSAAEGATPVVTNVFDRIKMKGMKAVPLLLAMLKDEYMVKTDMRSSSHSYDHSYEMMRMMGGDTDARDKMVERMYQSMQRPVTRSEIAMQMLRPLPMRKDDRSGRSQELGRDEFLEECKAWYEANKNKTPIELARAYFENGDSSQQNTAFDYLLRAGTETDMQAIEKNLLDQRNSRDTYKVQRYVEKRGEKAKTFLEKYEAKVTQPPQQGESDAEMFKDDRSNERIKTELAGLKELVSGKRLKDVIAEILAGTKTMAEVSSALYRKMSQEKQNDALTMVLDAALQAKDASTSIGFVHSVMSVKHRGYYGGYYGGAEFEFGPDGMPIPAGGDKKEKEELKPATHAEQWKKLLSDTRSVPGGLPGMSSTVGDTAAMMIGSLYAKKDDYSYYYAGRTSPSLGKRTMAIYKARAEAVLAGKDESELPEFPSTTDVTDEQKKAVAAKIMQADAGSLAQVIAGLSNADHLALIMTAKKDEKLRQKLAPYANTVRKVSGDGALAAAAKDLDGAKDKVIDRAAVEKALAVCNRLAGEGKVVTCSVGRLMCLDGIEINFHEIEPKTKEYEDLVEAKQIGDGMGPDVSATVADTGCHGAAVWLVGAPQKSATPAVEGAATPEDKIIDDIFKELDGENARKLAADQAEFWKAVADFSAGKGNVCRIGAVTIFGRAAVKDKPKPPKTPEKSSVTPLPSVVPSAGSTGVKPSGTVTKTIVSGDGKTVTKTVVTSGAGTKSVSSTVVSTNKPAPAAEATKGK